MDIKKECKICGKFYDPGNLSKHVLQYHDLKYQEYLHQYYPEKFNINIDANNELQCQICGKYVKNVGGLKTHLTKMHSCIYSEYMQEYFPNSTYHKKIIIDPSNKFQCQICGKIVNSTNGRYGTGISGHIIKHNISYKDYMLKYFNTEIKPVYKSDLDINHKDKSQCQICGKKFQSSSGLSCHLAQSHKVILEEYERKYFKIDNHCKGLFGETCNNTTDRKKLFQYETHCSDCMSKSGRPTQPAFWNRLYMFTKEESNDIAKLYLKNIHISIRHGVSKDSQVLFWNIYDLLTDDVKQHTYFHELNNEYCVTDNNKINYMYDFIITGDINKCIEYNGSKFHANPLIYDENDFPDPFNKHLSSKDIWDKDKHKISLLKEYRNIDTLVIWDNEYLDNSYETIDRCIKFLYGIV